MLTIFKSQPLRIHGKRRRTPFLSDMASRDYIGGWAMYAVFQENDCHVRGGCAWDCRGALAGLGLL